MDKFMNMTDWEILKSGAPNAEDCKFVVKTEEEEIEIPAWFKLEPGFKFMDGDSPAVVLGWGNKHDSTDIHVKTPFGTLTGCEMKLSDLYLMVATRYKGTWLIVDLEQILMGEVRPYEE